MAANQPRKPLDEIPQDLQALDDDIDYWTDQLAECSGGSERAHQIETRLKRLARAKEKKTMPSSERRESLLAEIDDAINTMPPQATIHHHDNLNNLSWFGRVTALIERWNPSKSSLAKEHLDLFFSNRHARERTFGLTKLLTLLHQAQAELRLEIVKVDGGAGLPTLPVRDIVSIMGKKIFIGHGGSLVWLQLREFLTVRLGRVCVEFNSDVVAGKTTTARLQEMLDDAGFAFLVMTAKDTHADSSTHARENVIHEAGLFQGRLGFERAIILLEEGCTQFSNIHGLTHIPFPKQNVEAAFEKIRQVLEREDSSTAFGKPQGEQRSKPEPIPLLSEAARELLLEASQDRTGMIMNMGMLSGRVIQTNNRGFVEEGNPRSEARWQGAVDELHDLGLIEDRAHSGEAFFVTDGGYQVADNLRQQ